MKLQSYTVIMEWAWCLQLSKVSLNLRYITLGSYSSPAIVNYWSPSTSTAIIRCPRDHYEMVWAALTYVTHLPKPLLLPVVIRVIRVTATIRKAEEEVIRRSQLIIQRAKNWEGKGDLPMLQSVEKAAERERREDQVLARVDSGSEDEDMSK
jgi:ribonuclease P/MRP protein subunit POP5